MGLYLSLELNTLRTQFPLSPPALSIPQAPNKTTGVKPSATRGSLKTSQPEVYELKLKWKSNLREKLENSLQYYKHTILS